MSKTNTLLADNNRLSISKSQLLFKWPSFKGLAELNGYFSRNLRSLLETLARWIA
ncbi:hypothetical protein [Alteromonas sp.]|uniref:hypothetical protein n=1 Tax=Alteromonas sp. TaxID=232 RepID=UPI00257E93A2|nr:hypothetical protein [Alteromonas sp.]NQY17175.1 hypothetical protein [Alteromonas sp.]